MPARKARLGEKPQFERFVETAHAVGAADTDELLDNAIRKIAPPKLPDKHKVKEPSEKKPRTR